jgi:acyl-CoA reductase-like NAD-dependent aldehyde dehydrogenase
MRMAEQAAEFAAAISPLLARSKADTLVTELLPLLDACRFLEREAAEILKTRRLGSAGRPLWLSGVQAEIRREPLGHVLVIGPSNFPLFLPGTQVLQALAAGNTVTWKPGAGGEAVARLMALALRDAGVPEGALRVTADTVEAAEDALQSAPGKAPGNVPDKVIFTGSQASGRAVLRGLAASGTPAVVELSGADAVVILPSADLALVAQAVAFGLRLNGSAVCMSPRRLFASAATLEALRPKLVETLAAVRPVVLEVKTAERLTAMVLAAEEQGARLLGELAPEAQRPLMIDDATAAMAIAQSDLFAPVIALIEVPSLLHLRAAYELCPYALTAAIFCGTEEMAKARTMAGMLRAGTVLINDVIAPTADPRVPFGGRGASGYGVTRGAEGLLEMTAVKTLLVRRRGSMRHYAATTDADVPMFEGMIRASHGSTWSERFAGVRRMISAAGKKG